MNKNLLSEKICILFTTILLLVTLIPFMGTATAETTYTVPDDYGTIQEAIDVASSGDTIFIKSGVYYEKIVIDKTLTLQGENKDDTIIGYPEGIPSSEYLALITADYVAISGITFLGNFDSDNRATYVVYSKGTDLTFENNNVHGFICIFGDLTNAGIRQNFLSTARKAIYVPGYSNIMIADNIFEPAYAAADSCWYNCGGIYMDHANNVIIQDNIMSDFSTSTHSSITHGRGIEGSHNSNWIISGNTFYNIRDAITMWIVDDITIHNNFIDGSARYGINIKGQDIEITKNTIQNSGDSGIHIAEYMIATTNIQIHNNNFLSNTNFGVLADNLGIVVDATLNYWGHASGPGGAEGRVNPAGKIIGKGDSVSSNVKWDPWSPHSL